MDAGDLKWRLRFERQTPADDGYGNVSTRGWELAAGPVWAKIQFAPGREQLKADALESLVPCIITIRDGTAARTITAAMRAVDARTGRTYRLVSVQPPDPRSGWIVMQAQLEQPIG